MASNASSTPGPLKGYNHQFVDQPPDDLLCLICLSVARDPQQITCCGKVTCKPCLEELKKHSNDCPQCRRSIVSFDDRRGESYNSKIQHYSTMTISQVIGMSSHLKLNVTIPPMVVSGLDN